MPGEPLAIRARMPYKRSIPARAGGTVDDAVGTQLDTGLSPRVRGNLTVGVGVEAVAGSIPARAGEPMFSTLIPLVVAVYPRACGGTAQPFQRSSEVTGLSPRVRGNRRLHRHGRHHARSIPARAGEPPTASST